MGQNFRFSRAYPAKSFRSNEESLSIKFGLTLHSYILAKFNNPLKFLLEIKESKENLRFQEESLTMLIKPKYS